MVHEYLASLIPAIVSAILTGNVPFDNMPRTALHTLLYVVMFSSLLFKNMIELKLFLPLDCHKGYERVGY